jgi:hypothetical protein
MNIHAACGSNVTEWWGRKPSLPDVPDQRRATGAQKEGDLALHPMVGRSVAGWQFMQRGFMITFAASVNRARERAWGSVIPAKAEGARSSALS